MHGSLELESTQHYFLGCYARIILDLCFNLAWRDMTYMNGQKIDPRLRELIPITIARKDRGSRNLVTSFFTILQIEVERFLADPWTWTGLTLRVWSSSSVTTQFGGMQR